MSIWTQLGTFLNSVTENALSGIVEAVRTVFSGDPETRRRVAFSVAIIALSAKMAKADGVVTMEEVGAFQQIFHVPPREHKNVERLFNLAKQDVAGFESYAARVADLCSGDKTCTTSLEDVLEGLFHIAKADGVIHERELFFLETTAGIFGISRTSFERILARHAVTGEPNPYIVLGIAPGISFVDAQRSWRKLVKDNHPDLMEARGVPKEFLLIANDRIRAINAAWSRLSPDLKRAELARA